MLDTLAIALTLGASLGCGLLAGVYFTFTAFAMQSFARIPDAAAIAAMREINIVILRSLFMPIFFGAPAVGTVAAVLAPFAWPGAAAVAAIVGAALIVGGNLVVTMVGNVPLNVALHRGTITEWRAFDLPWRRWNDIRTVTCTLAALAFALAPTLR